MYPVSQHHTERQDFREEIRDLARWKVHHRQDEPPHEIGLVVVPRDLRARGLHAELAEVDAQLVGGLPCFGEVLGLDDPAHADVDLDRKSTRLNSQSLTNLVCRLLLEKKKQKQTKYDIH